MDHTTETSKKHDANSLYAGILNTSVRVILVALCLSYLGYIFMDSGVSPNSIAAAWSRSSSDFAQYITAMNDNTFSLRDFLPELCVMALALISPVCIIALTIHYKKVGENLQWKLAAVLAFVFLFAASGLANLL